MRMQRRRNWRCTESIWQGLFYLILVDLILGKSPSADRCIITRKRHNDVCIVYRLMENPLLLKKCKQREMPPYPGLAIYLSKDPWIVRAMLRSC